MNIQDILIYVSTCLTMVYSLPLDITNTPDETIAIYVPYAIKYVPVEVPDEYLNAALNSNHKETSISNVADKENILEQIKNSNQKFHSAEVTEAFPIENSKLGQKSINSRRQNTERFLIIPHTSNTDADKIEVIPKFDILSENANIQDFGVVPVKEEFVTPENEDSDSTESEESLGTPSPPVMEISTVQAEDAFTSKPHSLSKRRAPGYFSYRPVFRYSRIHTSRRRSNPSRRHAMVGYMSDRDLFPTVA